MTWIETLNFRTATDEQKAKLREANRWRQMYPREYAAQVPALKELENEATGGGISDSHTLIPDAMYHAFSLLGSVLQPDLPLSRTQHEMIATVVSVINHCYY